MDTRVWDWREETSRRKGSVDLGDVEFGDLSRKKGNDKRARLAGGRRGAGRRGRRSRTGQHAVGEKRARRQGIPGLGFGSPAVSENMGVRGGGGPAKFVASTGVFFPCPRLPGPEGRGGGPRPGRRGWAQGPSRVWKVRGCWQQCYSGVVQAGGSGWDRGGVRRGGCWQSKR